MTNLYNALSDLLFQYDTVVLPGMGRFHCESQGAKVNVITNQFERPSVIVSFDSENKESDGVIVNYLCEQDLMSKSQAEQELQQFLETVQQRLQEGEQVSFPDLGTLSMATSGVLTFTPSEELQSNGDAFGLGDFTPTPVFISEPQDDWKQRIADQQREKNTKMTVDKDVMYVENEEELAELRRRRRSRTRRRVLAVALVLGLVTCLFYLKIIDIESIKKYFSPQPEQPVVKQEVPPSNPEVLRYMVSYYPPPEVSPKGTNAEDVNVELSAQPTDSIPVVAKTTETTETKKQEPETVESAKALSTGWNASYAPPASAKYFIVGGFFSEKNNALNHAQSLYEQGYSQAFLYPAGSKFYTCYGHYETKEEAKQALEEIKASTNPKAWLFERKR